MSDGLYYFDTLPIHPKPQPLESLTSYIARLGQDNGIKSYAGLSALFFPNHSTHVMRTIADYPNITLDQLSLITVCPESRLLSTTFHYLSKKFERSIHIRAVKQFLSRGIANHFRYCPYCVAEKGYYSLLWRFNIINGCPEHICLLLDSCGNCGSRIPFFNSHFRIGVCDHCGFEFNKSSTQKADTDQQYVNIKYSEQLNFLLSPHTTMRIEHLPVKTNYIGRPNLLMPSRPPNTTERRFVTGIGKRLSELRAERNLNQMEIEQLLGFERGSVAGIEHGARTPKAHFAAYIKYMDYFGLTFTEIYESVLKTMEDNQK